MISFLSKGLSKVFLQHHNLETSILQCSAFFIVQLSYPYMTTGKTIALTRWTFVGKVMSLLLICCLLLLLLSRFSRVRLFDPTDGSPPGCPIPGILQARTLEWIAISFSKVCPIASLPRTKCLLISWLLNIIHKEKLIPSSPPFSPWQPPFKFLFLCLTTLKTSSKWNHVVIIYL